MKKHQFNSSKLRWASLVISDCGDSIFEAWHGKHETKDEVFDCQLCGAAIFRCIDYTHAPGCPLEKAEKALGAAAAAIEELDIKLGEHDERKRADAIVEAKG